MQRAPIKKEKEMTKNVRRRMKVMEDMMERKTRRALLYLP
jgi:hypothetical protein